jgi:uncharacterized protein YjbI with pentapeptide repeats
VGLRTGLILPTPADLFLAVLRTVELTGAILERAILESASLSRADVTLANLTGAILFDANLRNADLTGAILEGADLRNVFVGSLGLEFTVGSPFYNRFTDFDPVAAAGQLTLSQAPRSC